MAGFLLFGTGFYVLVARVPRSRPPLVELEQSLSAADDREAESVRLVLFESGPDERLIETPVMTDLVLPEDLAVRLEVILAALRDETLGDLWPEGLSAPVVYTYDSAAPGSPTAVVDFVRGEPVAVTVDQERLLLASVRATLLRNGARDLHILINHRESDSFLGHILLEQGSD